EGILSPTEVFKDVLHSRPMAFARVGLVSTRDTQSKSDIRSRTYHRIHDGSNGRRIRNISHAFYFLRSGSTLSLGKTRALGHRQTSSFRLRHAESSEDLVYYVINIQSKEDYSTPTDLLVYTRFIRISFKTKADDSFVKADVPTP
ncbi:unnamed protein product, partial [Cuscuta campestris]